MNRKVLSGLFAAMLIGMQVGAVQPAWAGKLSLADQRQLFSEAKADIQKERFDVAATKIVKLGNYPLTPYLHIWMARKQLSMQQPDTVVPALQKYADIPESSSLRFDWARWLYENGKSEQAMQQLQQLPGYIRNNPVYVARNQWEKGNREVALATYSQLWLQGKGDDPVLKPVADAWSATHPTRDELWERASALVADGKKKQAKRWLEKLGDDERELLKQWQQQRAKPLQSLQQWQGRDLSAHELTVVDNLLSLAYRQDLEATWALLASDALHLPDGGRMRYQQKMAERAAWYHMPEARQWLAAIPPAIRTHSQWEWLVRVTLLDGNYRAALQVIDAMPPKLRGRAEWTYWKGRCLLALDRQQEAAPLFAQLADERGYYSFLSAERLGQQPVMSAEPGPMDLELYVAMQQWPGIVRAHEWLRLGETAKATMEWRHALHGKPAATWAAAARLAKAWGWYDQAIRSAARAGIRNDLQLRFPMPHLQAVQKQEDKLGLPSPVIYGMIRQESLFNPDARSRVGATGLMQLMPATARHVRKRIHMPAKQARDLTDPRVNIRLGTAYLHEMLERFDGQLYAAIAAYNAGPHRVSQWLERVSTTDPEIWIENIPFSETRRYVKQILGYSVVYQWQMEQTQLPILSLLTTSDWSSDEPSS